MQIIRKDTERDSSTREPITIRTQGELVYLTFPALEETHAVRHLFSTRLGGVSQGHLASMNLSYTRGDSREAVDENFRRIGQLLGRELSDFVLTNQTHTANVRVVSNVDRGKGLVREQDFSDVDGFVTKDTGVVLCAFFADCVPLFFVDPRQKAIGLSHSGWKGTQQKIGRVTVETMTRQFGSRPEDIIAAIGPSICGDCYEVSADVAEQFLQMDLQPEKSAPVHRVLREKGNGKYLLDLWEANRRILLEAGLLPEHISVTNICTCCNPQFLFSHRASGGRRGNMGAFLALQEEESET